MHQSKQKTGFALLCAAIVVCAGGIGAKAAAQATVPPRYPRVDIRPAHPASGDIVTLRLVRGLASSPCYAPTYKDTSFLIRLLANAARPPLYEVTLEYTEVPPPPDIICLAIYDPTEYGPSYRLGALSEGTYIVKDGNTVVDTFVVTDVPVGPRGSISGIVYENTGALPVVKILPNVKVYLQVPLSTGDPVPMRDMLWPPYMTVDSTVSDTSGAYAFAALEPGIYRLSFVGNGYQPHSAVLNLQGDTVVNVWLLPADAAVTVSGTVVEGCGTVDTLCLWTPPLEGCTVSVTIMIPLIELAKGQALAAWTAVTDVHGRYTIHGVPVYDQSYAEYLVTARKSGFVTQSRSVNVQYGIGPTVDFVMKRAWLGAGRPTVLSRTGPAVGAAADGSALRFALATQEIVRCRAYGLDGRRAPGLSFDRLLPPGNSVITLPKGLRPGVYLLRVTADGVEKVLDIRVGP